MKKSKSPQKQLLVAQEKVRELTTDQLAQAAGGGNKPCAKSYSAISGG
jgi:hypothetical protein